MPHLPQPGQTLAAADYTQEVGGKGLNVAVALRRLGYEVHALLACSQDAAGRAL